MKKILNSVLIVLSFFALLPQPPTQAASPGDQLLFWCYRNPDNQKEILVNWERLNNQTNSPALEKLHVRVYPVPVNPGDYYIENISAQWLTDTTPGDQSVQFKAINLDQYSRGNEYFNISETKDYYCSAVAFDSKNNNTVGFSDMQYLQKSVDTERRDIYPLQSNSNQIDENNKALYTFVRGQRYAFRWYAGYQMQVNPTLQFDLNYLMCTNRGNDGYNQWHFVCTTLKTGKTSISIAEGNKTISQVLDLTITDTPQEYSNRYCKNPPENTEQFNCNDEFFRGGWVERRYLQCKTGFVKTNNSCEKPDASSKISATITDITSNSATVSIDYRLQRDEVYRINCTTADEQIHAFYYEGKKKGRLIHPLSPQVKYRCTVEIVNTYDYMPVKISDLLLFTTKANLSPAPSPTNYPIISLSTNSGYTADVKPRICFNPLSNESFVRSYRIYYQRNDITEKDILSGRAGQFTVQTQHSLERNLYCETIELTPRFKRAKSLSFVVIPDFYSGKDLSYSFRNSTVINLTRY